MLPFVFLHLSFLLLFFTYYPIKKIKFTNRNKKSFLCLRGLLESFNKSDQKE